jgi:hypothetical protein
MTALEQVAQMKQQAIDVLLNERELIDQELSSLGHGQGKAPSGKRRGRRPKAVIESEDLALAASHS